MGGGKVRRGVKKGRRKKMGTPRRSSAAAREVKKKRTKNNEIEDVMKKRNCGLTSPKMTTAEKGKTGGGGKNYRSGGTPKAAKKKWSWDFQCGERVRQGKGVPGPGRKRGKKAGRLTGTARVYAIGRGLTRRKELGK